MSVLNKIIGRIKPAFAGGSNSGGAIPPESRSSTSLRQPAKWLLDIVRGGTSKTVVNERTSMGLSAAYACVQIISNTVSNLQHNLFRETKQGKEIAVDHYLFDLVHEQPHPLITQQFFTEYLMCNALLKGKGFALINRHPQSGKVQSLTPIPTIDCSPIQNDAGIVEYYKIKGLENPVHVDDLFIIQALQGLSPIALHAETFRTGISAQKYGNDFFESGGSATNFLFAKDNFNKQQVDGLVKSWNESNTPDNAHDTKLIPYGLDFKRVTIPPGEAQYIETKKFSRDEICTIYGVPKFLIGGDGSTTYNNTEEQNKHFAQYCLLPWIKKFEAQWKTKVLKFETDKLLKVKINLDSLLRGDIKTRADFYKTMFNIGSFSVNQILALEGFNKIEGGDTHFINMNQMPLEKADDYAQSIIDGKSQANTSKPPGDE